MGPDMIKLVEYVKGHTDCMHPELADHNFSVDMVYMAVATRGEVSAGEFRDLVVLAQQGDPDFNLDLFDGSEHSYMEIGGFVGDQGCALRLMGLGTLLKLWELYTPLIMLPGISRVQAEQMAGSGLLTVRSVQS